MLDLMFWVAVGAFVGWNIPQPRLAVMFSNFVKAKWAAFRSK